MIYIYPLLGYYIILAWDCCLYLFRGHGDASKANRTLKQFPRFFIYYLSLGNRKNKFNNTMFAQNYLNEHSKKLVENIYMNFITHPAYSSYKISKKEGIMSKTGSIDLYIEKDGKFINRFCFHGFCNTGDIDYILIYGNQLNGHIRSIKSSMKIFDLPVEDVTVGTNQLGETFVCVDLK